LLLCKDPVKSEELKVDVQNTKVISEQWAQELFFSFVFSVMHFSKISKYILINSYETIVALISTCSKAQWQTLATQQKLISLSAGA
jgi:hypothetical protein